MYLPKHFEESDPVRLAALIRRDPLGTLVINGPEGLVANHLPFVYRSASSGPGVLCAHIPLANPLSEWLGIAAPCLVIFRGAQGYISPAWYATKQEHGRVVPTWNYAVVHAHGTVRLIRDQNWIMGHLNELTDQQEASRAEPWSVTDAPESFTSQLVQSLVGIEIVIERLEGKVKASQNQPEENQASVLDAVEAEQSGTALASLMQSVLPTRK